MSPAEVETIYEALATRLDAIGDQQRELFLAKLVLLLSHDVGEVDGVLRRIDEACNDL